MTEEGVIKYDLQFTKRQPPSLKRFNELLEVRKILWEHALIGQDPARYGGYGFGNISQRLPGLESAGNIAFLVSASQTGGLRNVSERDFAVVTAFNPASNRVDAWGVVPPSSESLTHGIVYRQSTDINVVLHVHSPDIWQNAPALKLPVTAASVEYGTPDMAEEVNRLFHETDVMQRQLFSMGGHEDGIVAFAGTAGAAARILLGALSKSR